MLAGVMTSSISGGAIGLIVALSADFGLMAALLFYSGGGILATVALLICHTLVSRSGDGLSRGV